MTATKPRVERWAGAVVVTPFGPQPEILLIEAASTPDDPRLTLPSGRVETDLAPLVTAATEVRLTSGVSSLRYVAFLGEQIGQTGSADERVAWFLLATDPNEASSPAGGHWVPLAEAMDMLSDQGVAPHLHRARDVVSWRRKAALPYSLTLSDIIWRCALEAAPIVSEVPGAGIGVCGSGARGDYIDGWSDIDLISWGMDPSSIDTEQLRELAAALEQDYGVATSLDLADSDGRDAIDGDPLYNVKLQTLIHQSALYLPVLAGASPPQIPPPQDDGQPDESLRRLHRFVVRHIESAAPTERARAHRARRVLSVACTAGRRTAAVLRPEISFELPTVASTLDDHWPGNRLTQVLVEYARFRQAGAADISGAEDLAQAVPEALRELRDLAQFP